MGAGKTTLAYLTSARLESVTGLKWRVGAFADALKQLVCTSYGFPLCLAYSSIGKKSVPPAIETTIKTNDLPFPLTTLELAYINSRIRHELWPYRNTVGQLLQYIGQFFRDIKPDYWVQAFETTINVDECVVIEDVRYPNEVQWLQQHNFGVVCRVYGPTTNINDEETRDTQHASETALDSCTSWDFTIDNSIRTQDMSKLHIDLIEKLSKYLN